MWLNICQGFVLFACVARMLHNVKIAAMGKDKVEPTGAVGVFSALVIWGLYVVVVWRAGAFSTIVAWP